MERSYLLEFLAALLAAIAVCAFAFGYWGLFGAGKNRFDEMDGIIPVCSLLGSSVPAVTAVILAVVAARR
jgi:hypothetical protein